MGNTPESKNLLKERSEPMRKRGKGKGRRICWRGWESGEATPSAKAGRGLSTTKSTKKHEVEKNRCWKAGRRGSEKADS